MLFNFIQGPNCPIDSSIDIIPHDAFAVISTSIHLDISSINCRFNIFSPTFFHRRYSRDYPDSIKWNIIINSIDRRFRMVI